AEVEAQGESLFFSLHLPALEPVAKRNRKCLVARIFEPLLRVHVGEVEEFWDALHVLDVLCSGGAVNEDEVEALPRQEFTHLSRENWRIEVRHRRRHSGG